MHHQKQINQFSTKNHHDDHHHHRSHLSTISVPTPGNSHSIFVLILILALTGSLMVASTEARRMSGSMRLIVPKSGEEAPENVKSDFLDDVGMEERYEFENADDLRGYINELQRRYALLAARPRFGRSVPSSRLTLLDD